MQRLSVLTLNIWHREAPWEQRRELIRKGLRALDPDIIGLQEVLELRSGDALQSQAEELLRDLPYRYVFGRAQSFGPGFEFGNVIAAKYPLRGHQVWALPGAESGETRSVVHARVAAPCGEVPVFVTHLNWKQHHGSLRTRQVQRLVELVQTHAPVHAREQEGNEARGPVPEQHTVETYPPILLGDFNAEPDSHEIRFLRGFTALEGQTVFFADAWVYGGDGSPGFTFDRRNPYAARAHEPPRRIDYIFVRGPDASWRGEPLLTRLVFDTPEDGVWASDHFGLYSELSLRAETPAYAPA